MAIPAKPSHGANWDAWADGVDTAARGAAQVADIPAAGTATGDALRAAFVARSEGFVVVTHNAVASTVRPAAPAVYWIGTVQPTNLQDQDFWWNPAVPAESYEPLNGTASRLLTAGESTVERLMAARDANPSASQGLRLTYLTAQKTETVTHLRLITAGTAAAPTPTLCRLGVYEENVDGSLTLIHSTANDTSLFAAALTRYTVPLTDSWAKVRGKRYAIGRLIVSAATTPSFRGLLDAGGVVNEWAEAPRMTAQWTGQSNLPASVPVANLSNSSQFDYVALVPAA